MKRLPLLITLLACTAATPAPRPSLKVAGAVGLAPGDTLAYKLSWTAGARASSYGVRVTASRGTWTGLPNGATTTALTYSFNAGNPTWDSVTFTAKVWSLSAAGVASRDTAMATWRVVRLPSGPGGVTVDSSGTILGLSVKPDSVTLAAGGTQQFCAFAKKLDGKWYGTTNTDGSETALTPYCVNGYAGWFPLAERTPTLQTAAWRRDLPIERPYLRLTSGERHYKPGSWSWPA